LTLAALARSLKQQAKAKVQNQATRDWLIEILQKGFVVDASCHGAFNIDAPLQSALRLSRREMLTLGQVLSREVDLQGLRLLILSACQTAILDLRGVSDEVYSLAAGMLSAGAKAVLASLWSVDDRATYLLMVRFAQEWFPHMGKEPPAAALARAQDWLRTVTNADLLAWQTLHFPTNCATSCDR
jgi:CHAT domain-containing protein